MKRRPLGALILVAALALAARGHAGDLRIEDAWARATPPGTPVGAGYMVIVNDAGEPDRLVGASSPVAGRVQLHRTVERDGTSRMEHEADGAVVPAGGRLRLAPGGRHLMLMELVEPLEEGTRVPVTLRFARTGTLETALRVRPLAGGAGAD